MAKYAVGLIGGIATGKSLACQYFAELGITVIDTDQIARDIVAPGQPLLQVIIDHFGPQLLTQEQMLNRKALRDIIFNDPTERVWLEKQLHPAIRERVAIAVKQAKGPYCVVAIPLLKQRTQYPMLHSILAIKTDPLVQQQRLLSRDSINAELANRIMLTQPTLTETLDLADYVIDNNTTPDVLKKQILAFDEQVRTQQC